MEIWYQPFHFKFAFYGTKSAKRDKNKKSYVLFLKESGIFMCGA
jgi:hypothetical protein